MQVPLSWLREYVTIDAPTSELADRLSVASAEVKSIERLLPVHSKQLLTYLRLMKQPVGLLLNFSGETMKEGIRRMVNDHRPETAFAPSASSAPLREPPSPYPSCTALSTMQASTPSGPSSLPWPDHFTPPNGASAPPMMWLLMPSMPVSISAARRRWRW